MRQWWVILLVASAACAQTPNVETIIAKSKATMAGVKDFRCILTVSMRSTSVRVPESRAKVLFKQPDRFKALPLDGDYSVLPNSWRLGLGNALGRLNETCNLRVLREETLGDRRQIVLRADEKNEVAEGVYHLVWVDAERYTVGAMRSYVPNQHPVTLTIGYEKRGEAWLPNLMNLDAKFRNHDGQDEQMAAKLTMTSYEVNVGLKDSDFKDKD